MDFKHTILPYAASLLLGLFAAILAFAGSFGFAAGGIFLAALSFLTTRKLIRTLAAANEQACFLDEKLIQSQKLASIGELSAGIGHEINNPLAIISQETEWMQHLAKRIGEGDSKGVAELQDSLKEVLHQVDRCREITQNLLDFARRKEPVYQEVNVNKLIEDLSRLVEKEAVLHQIEIRREFQLDLPLVQTDAPSLRQVVLNLLTNASHAIQKDGLIRIATKRSENGSVDIIVADTGCGIPKDHLAKIFDPFFTTKPEGKGTGLGLSICHGIVDKLGGRISVSSEVGKGSTFVVTLPVNQQRG
ncbi:MAG: ATP-binding protein [Desulfobacterota bacterium]|jgi:two-component system NtrC family sensor kinase|nr:ATP-binding protein [Thermodesulfobacteriota bacterium]